MVRGAGDALQSVPSGSLWRTGPAQIRVQVGQTGRATTFVRLAIPYFGRHAPLTRTCIGVVETSKGALAVFGCCVENEAA